MTTALEGGEWSAARPGRTLPPEKTRYPFYRRLGVPQGWSGRAENLIPIGIRSQTVQPVVSRYTDWATRPTTRITVLYIKTDLHLWQYLARFFLEWEMFLTKVLFLLVSYKLQSTQHRVISKVEVRNGREAGTIHRWFTGALLLG